MMAASFAAGAFPVRRTGARVWGTELLVFLASLIPLLVTPVVPTIDFYNHVGRYFILSHFGQLPYLGQSYLPAWKILPNLGLDLIAMPFFSVLPPLLAAKAILMLIFAVQYSGVLALSRAINGKSNLAGALLAAILLYSYILAWGFANFLLASGLILWGLALWFALRDRLVLAALAGSVFSVLIFFCHGFAFALYGLILALFELGRWLRSDRRFSALARTAIAVAVQAILPAILFRMAATSSAGLTAGERLAAQTQGHALAQRLVELMQHQAFAILRVANSPSLLLDVATFVVVGAALVLAWRRRVIDVERFAVPALLVLAALCFLTPPSLFGVGKISDRLPLVTLLVLAALIRPARDRSIAWTWLVRGLAAVFVVRLAVIAAAFAQYGADFEDFAAVAAAIPPHAIVAPAAPTALLGRDQDAMRCQMYNPLTAALFGTRPPLFAIPSQQPMLEHGELAARAALAGQRVASTIDPLSVEPAFEYYLACGYTALPTDRFTVLARRGRFVLLKAGRGS